jgi:hypothetical protein
VTGKGNIVASRKHARVVGTHVVTDYMRLADGIGELPPFTAEAREKLENRVRELQARVGYSGDYRAWIRAVTPPDLA